MSTHWAACSLIVFTLSTLPPPTSRDCWDHLLQIRKEKQQRMTSFMPFCHFPIFWSLPGPLTVGMNNTGMNNTLHFALLVTSPRWQRILYFNGYFYALTMRENILRCVVLKVQYWENLSHYGPNCLLLIRLMFKK